MLASVLLNADRALFWVLLALLLWELFKWWRGLRQVKPLPGGGTQFGAARFGIALCAMMAAMIPLLAVGYVRQGAYRMAVIVPVCLLIAIIVKILDLPAVLVVNSEGIDQHYWLRGDKHIRWSEIAEVIASPKAKAVVIKAANGVRIDHSALRSVRDRLLAELKLHRGSELPSRASGQPVTNA